MSSDRLDKRASLQVLYSSTPAFDKSQILRFDLSRFQQRWPPDQIYPKVREEQTDQLLNYPLHKIGRAHVWTPVTL